VDGYVNLWKPSGPTSFDVVRQVRRAIRVKRIGHGGTLDPLAEGVLPLFVGRATRLVEYLSVGAKEYRATVRLGVSTDTLDREGEIVEQRDYSAVSRQDVESLLSEFTGTIAQIPPMYSALKHQGQRLHRLARQGVTVERQSRDTIVHSIEILEWAPPIMVLNVVCGGGTYVRTLAADIGDRLDCGASLDALVRSRVGPFLGDLAVSPEHIQETVSSEPMPVPTSEAGWWIPLVAPFRGWLALHLTGDGLRLALTGSILDQNSGVWTTIPGNAEPPFVLPAPTNLAVALGPEGDFVGILHEDSRSEGWWRPKKVLMDGQGIAASETATR
jgi:tRNA pseudouridine(55) synthase